jgi:predicted nuclease of predicted toxin-antitoxin system
MDDCAHDKILVKLLRRAGHVVATPFDAGIAGRADDVHMEWAAKNGYVLLTKDPDDFAELHALNPNHAGILAIHADNDPTRDMNHADVVRAISNIINTGLEFKGNYHILNAWRY